MKSQLKEKAAAFEPGEKLEHELVACRARLTEADELVASYKKAEALLQAEQRLTEKIARGDVLQEILEEACKLVERALAPTKCGIVNASGFSRK